jgi:hypothetical protein
VVVPRWVCQEDRGGDLFDRKFEISTTSTQQTSNSTNSSPSLPNNRAKVRWTQQSKQFDTPVEQPGQFTKRTIMYGVGR